MSVVHRVARDRGLRVVGSYSESWVDRSFYSVVVAGSDGRKTLLLNPATRVVASVRGEHPHPAGVVYVDVDGPANFVEAGFKVPSPAELDAALYDGDLAELDAEEAEQVRYHRPGRVGELIFNWFD
jgi:hypothetical protein